MNLPAEIYRWLNKYWSDAQVAHFAFGLWPVLALRLWGVGWGLSALVPAGIGVIFLVGFKLGFPSLDQDPWSYNWSSLRNWLIGTAVGLLLARL